MKTIMQKARSSPGAAADFARACILGTLLPVMAGAAPVTAADAAQRVGALRLGSPAFAHSAAIPAKYTCEGLGVSPPLEWSGVPANARSLVLIVDDPDAPDPAAPQTTWVHWLLYNVPTSTRALPEAASSLPAGAVPGLNDFNDAGYGGPCPPVGRHRYLHKLYALDVMLPRVDGATKTQIEALMKGHVIARAELIGTYQKRH